MESLKQRLEMELNEKKRINKLYNEVQEEIKKKVADYKPLLRNRTSQSFILTHDIIPICILFLGFTNLSAWGSTSVILVFMLYWNEQMKWNCPSKTKPKTNTYHKHLI